MILRISGGSLEKPLYCLEYQNGCVNIIEDSASGIKAAVMRVFLQIIGKRDYKLQHVAGNVASSLDKQLEVKNFGRGTRKFRVQIADRDKKIMGRLSRIQPLLWEEVSRFGQRLLQITNDSWYQSNDVSFAQTNDARHNYQEIHDMLQADANFQLLCTRFVERCPSKLYRSIIRLALSGSHATTDDFRRLFD